MLSLNRALGQRAPRLARAFLPAILGALLLTGCLEQIQTTRIPGGALSNFLIHLQQAELDDARAYMAPGVVTPSATLDASIKEASQRVRVYEIRNKKSSSKPLDNGELQVTITAQVRPRTAAGSPTPAPDQGWQQTDVITARIVERGPGWRILNFELKCCP
ncbi:MAG: hypothetical protein ACJ78Q_16610 [Chloroflexia bacterium]